MYSVTWFPDVVGARHVAHRLRLQFPNLTRDEKETVVAQVEEKDTRLAAGLRKVWHLGAEAAA